MSASPSGGLPLAIELASATMRELSPAALRERLESSLDFLVGGPIDSPARQQTMRATIEWSYGLLGQVEQQHLAPLAVFSGGWSAEAARKVCGTTSETLGSLREKGMIFSVGERYGMLTPIREFAREALTSSEAESLARRHAAYFTTFASEFDNRVRQHGFEPDNLHRFRGDYENVRAALRWAHAAGETELFPRLAASFGVYSYVIGPYGEAREWLEIALAEPPEDAVLHGMVARSLGMVSAQQGDYHALGAAAERAVALFRSAGETELEAKATQQRSYRRPSPRRARPRARARDAMPRANAGARRRAPPGADGALRAEHARRHRAPGGTSARGRAVVDGVRRSLRSPAGTRRRGDGADEPWTRRALRETGWPTQQPVSRKGYGSPTSSRRS